MGRLSGDLSAQLSRRLSDKQRLSFDWIVDHNYRGTLTDEYFESQSESRHKILSVLNRRISNRPHPSDITNTTKSLYYPQILVDTARTIMDTQNDEENNYNMNGMNGHVRNSSDPNPNGTNNNSQFVKNYKANDDSDVLNWKFGQRSNAKELVERGIVSAEYEQVILGEKDIEDAERERLKNYANTSQKIDKIFKHGLRPSADELELRGLAPPGLLKSENDEMYDSAMEEYEKSRNEPKKKISQKLGQRMPPSEAIARNIIAKDTLDKV